MPSSLDRRRFLSGSLALGLAGLAERGRAATPRCGPSVPTGAGPFYPGDALTEISDLVSLPGHDEAAQGQVIALAGTVRGRDCQPIAGAVVEIWQADRDGRYKHPRAGEQDALDPHFAYFARARTDAEGRYRFRTIVPGSYEFAGVRRAAHIHVKVAHRAHGALITEMYFAGADHERRRERDRVFRSRGDARRSLIAAPGAGAAGAPHYRFDLALT